jgi:coenzyme F420-reducing hydrogenase delta subunit
MAGETVTAPKAVVFHCASGVLVRPDPDKTGPAAVQTVYLPCTGATTLSAVLARLQEGARGVMLAGCPVETCRFPHPSGCPAERLAQKAKTLMRMLGLNEQRIHYARCGSDAETRTAAQAFVDGLHGLKPLPAPGQEAGP